MNLILFENSLIKFSFASLFLSMLGYWIETSFSLKLKWSFAKITMYFANILLVSFLVSRWIESGHFPLSNLYESLIFLSWTLSSLHIFLELQFQNNGETSPQKNVPSISPINTTGSFRFELNTKQSNLIGCITSPTILLIQAFATLSLPKEMQMPSALVPALQSNWLMMHVTLMILSYAALILGCLFSVAYLIIARNQNFQIQGNSLGSKISSVTLDAETSSNMAFTTAGNFKVENFTALVQNKTDDNFFGQKKETQLAELSKMFDNLSYRILGIGFPLLTIGILSGAVWANEAWGSYWSWDPKETWALLTWLIFAIYLHTRLTKGWSGKGPALIASLGLLSVWVCFLGVNLLGQGLHSYGWIFEKNA